VTGVLEIRERHNLPGERATEVAPGRVESTRIKNAARHASRGKSEAGEKVLVDIHWTAWTAENDDFLSHFGDAQVLEQSILQSIIRRMKI